MPSNFSVPHSGNGVEPPSGAAGAAIGGAQLGVLAVNAVSRQIVENVEVHRLYDVSAQPTALQWGPMVLFLVSFLAGAAVVGRIIAHVLKAHS